MSRGLGDVYKRQAFERSLPAMNALYSSAVGTTVLQLKEIPPRPDEYDGALCLFGLKEGVDDAAVLTALRGFGTVVSCDLARAPPVVAFSAHAEALKAKEAGAPSLCAGVDTLYNEHPYDKRGWCASASF